MSSHSKKGSFSFRRFDELTVLLAVFFFIFGCIIIPEPPIPVELNKFSDLSTSKELQFESPPESQSFHLNISRYATVGNSSIPAEGNPGVVQNFSMRICPIEHMGSNVSNLTMHWPGGESYMFYPGTLDSCEEVSINASGFNSYLSVHQAPTITGMLSKISSGENVSMEWGISMKNPKMKDVDDPVTYQFMIIEPSIPENLIEQLIAATGTALPPGFDLLTDARLSGVSYTCYGWDQVRETTSPSAAYPIQVSVPGMNLSALIPDLTIPNGTVVMNASVFEMDCPAYGTPGKYRSEVRRLQLNLNNYTGPVPSASFSDDFNSPSLNPAWVFEYAGTPSVLGWYVDNSTQSTVELYSEGNASGSSAYYYRNHTIDSSGGAFVLEANISTAGEPPINMSMPLPEGAGMVAFTTNHSYPGPMASAGTQLRSFIAFGNNATLIGCPDGTRASIIPTSSGYHTFRINITNDTATYAVDGAQVFQCTNHTSAELYPMFSSDFLTDGFMGNISVDWINITAYSGGPGTWSEEWSEFDHFDSPLDTGKWLMRNVSVPKQIPYYSYQPSLSKIDLYSYNTDENDNSTGILMYYNESFAPPTSNESGIYFTTSVYFNESNPAAAPGFMFMNDTVSPAGFSELEDNYRGGIIYSNGYIVLTCPNTSKTYAANLSQLSYIMGWGEPTGWHQLGYYSTNDTTAFFYDDMPMPLNCSPHNESVYIAITSDPTTDLTEGNGSVRWFEAYSVEYEENYYGEKWFDLGLLSYMGYINRSMYSDVIVFDADSEGNYYDREFEFEVTSDTPGRLQMDALNITYGSLISYGPGGTAPTTTLDPDSDFSWFAINSEIDNSHMRLNSFAYNSTLTDSELIMARADCVNITDSRLLFSGAVYNTEEKHLGELGGLLEDLNMTSCDGVVENSELEFVFLIGGNAFNSELKTLPAIIATDFYDATMDNLTLYRGRMVINGTRAPDMFQDELDLGDFMGIGLSTFEDNTTLPFSCEEQSTMAIDGAADLRLADAPAKTVNCRFELHNSNFTVQNLTFDNEFGGIRVSLDNSSLHVNDMPEPINLTTYGQLTDVVIWNLDTSLLSGPLVVSDEGIYIETGMASVNKTAPGANMSEISDLFNISLIYNNVGEWDGSITYYGNFTRNRTHAMQSGIECPADRCQNVVFDRSAHTIRVDISNFSTYVVNYTEYEDEDEEEDDDGPDDVDYQLEVEGACAGSAVNFTASRSGLGTSGITIRVYGPDNQSLFYGHDETGSHGRASFTPTFPGTYYYSAGAAGYTEKTGSIEILNCTTPSGEAPPAEPIPEEEPPAGTPSKEECYLDADCPAGHWCIENECVLAIEPTEEGPGPEITPPSQAQEVPSVAEPKEEAGETPPCCLVGICLEVLGVCWYYWVAGLAILGLFVIIYINYPGKKR
ncbi:hypothetical protein GF415_04455 [Candidatus Micrarchaeota archaeon]|nr:hypothetical protein [Candidatus Micrarchaeota archaeon]